MLKKRLIPVLLLRDGQLVRGEAFSSYRVIGDPLCEAERFNQWNVDELVYLDIGGSDAEGRQDTRVAVQGGILDVLDAVARTCFSPLTFGGGIRTVEDARERISRGADKVTLGTAAIANPALVAEVASVFGSQAVVVSIDARRFPNGYAEVFARGGHEPTTLDPVDYAREVEQLGAGEILLTSIDRDGTGRGYDLDLIREVSSAVRIPVIACGGAGCYEDFAAGIAAGASAVAAANIFHFQELADRRAKRAMRAAGIDVRV